MSNLPDDVTQKMIDNYYAEDNTERGDNSLEYRLGDSRDYSYSTLSIFLQDCRDCGGVSAEEYLNLQKHLNNIRG